MLAYRFGRANRSSGNVGFHKGEAFAFRPAISFENAAYSAS
jgi:hypothetical protein